MTSAGWRNAALVLAVICCYQRWDRCTASAPRPTQPSPAAEHQSPPSRVSPRLADTATTNPTDPAPARTFYGIKLPTWVTRLAPQPGESIRDYRARVLPLAQLAIAPQRARVARARDELTTLDARQRAELDAAVAEAAAAIEARVRAAIASGELRPTALKPMAGIAIARELLDIVDRGNARFLGSLAPDQRAQLASHRFDFADYLVFSTRWEDALD